MKKIFTYTVLMMAVLLTSCEKNINLDLNKSNPQYVIEAKLYHGEQPFVVNIKKTTDYYGKEQQQKVDNAIVYLYEVGGDSAMIPLQGSGYYAAQVNTTIGKTYKLKVVIDGKEYTSEARMPAPVNMDSLQVDKSVNGNEDEFRLTVELSDMGNVPNYYSVILTVNDTVLSTANNLYLFDDRLNDGRTIRYDVMRVFHRNDKVRAELVSMDGGVYSYFKSLYDAVNSDSSPAPANPHSNFGIVVLGYFGAFSSTSKSIAVQ